MPTIQYGSTSLQSAEGGEAQDEGGGGLPERDERGNVGDGDHVEEQRRMGAEVLPDDGCSRAPCCHAVHPHCNML